MWIASAAHKVNMDAEAELEMGSKFVPKLVPLPNGYTIHLTGYRKTRDWRAGWNYYETTIEGALFPPCGDVGQRHFKYRGCAALEDDSTDNYLMIRDECSIDPAAPTEVHDIVLRSTRKALWRHFTRPISN